MIRRACFLVLVSVGLLPGQSISASFGGTEAGTYDSANAGARGVTVGTLPVGDFTAGSGTLLSNYILPTVWTGSGSITPAPLTGSFVLTAGIVNASKVYDGTTDIVLDGANFTLSGFVNGDSAVVNDGIHATFGQKDIGTDLPLSAQLTISDLTATNGTSEVMVMKVRLPARRASASPRKPTTTATIRRHSPSARRVHRENNPSLAGCAPHTISPEMVYRTCARW